MRRVIKIQIQIIFKARLKLTIKIKIKIIIWNNFIMIPIQITVAISHLSAKQWCKSETIRMRINLNTTELPLLQHMQATAKLISDEDIALRQPLPICTHALKDLHSINLAMINIIINIKTITINNLSYPSM